MESLSPQNVVGRVLYPYGIASQLLGILNDGMAPVMMMAMKHYRDYRHYRLFCANTAIGCDKWR